MTYLMILIFVLVYFIFGTQDRKPDLTIGPVDDPQTLRWHLFNRWGFQVALHKWVRSDNDRALHDHSSDNFSILLWGTYREWFSHNWEAARWSTRYPLIPYFRKAETPHRIELHATKPVWTLWFRFKPRREWGFHCAHGWRHWKDYVAERQHYDVTGTSSVGQGCD